MLGFIVAGSFGAALNCALASYFSSTFDHVLQEFFLTPLSFAKSAVVPAVFGFFEGTLLLVFCSFLKARVLRFLLGYNGWFLNPKRPINKASRHCLHADSVHLPVFRLPIPQLWFFLMMALLGKKDRGSLAYQDYLPSLPLPPLKDTCRR